MPSRSCNSVYCSALPAQLDKRAVISLAMDEEFRVIIWNYGVMKIDFGYIKKDKGAIKQNNKIGPKLISLLKAHKEERKPLKSIYTTRSTSFSLALVFPLKVCIYNLFCCSHRNELFPANKTVAVFIFSMASSGKVNLLGKRDAKDDDLESKPILKKHKENSDLEEKIKGRVELLETNSDQTNLIPVDETPDFVVEAVAAVGKKTLLAHYLARSIQISDIIDFFKDVAKVVSVQITVNHKDKHRSCGFVEFASANEAKKAQENKNGKHLCGNNITLLRVADIAPYPPRPRYCIDHKIWYEDYLRREGEEEEEEEETPPDFVEIVAVRKKTLFVTNLSPQTKMLHIINFFSDIGEVVSVRLIVNPEGKHVGYSFVEFPSADEAKKALENKNGEYLHDHKIFLDVAKTAPYINFFKDVATVVHVRLGVNHKGKQYGYGFVEFASANEAKKALEKDGEYLLNRKIYLDVAKADPPSSSPQPKYYIDHKVWYEDYLRQEGLLIEEDEAVEGLDETHNFVEEVAVRKKTLFIANLSFQTKIPDIISFFKDVGEVFSVRLIVNHRGEHVGCGFVEFASANEAKKALEKNGRTLHFQYIFLSVAEIAPYPLRPKYNLAEKLWYEDYLGRESLLIEEDDLETKPNKKMKLVGVYKKAIFGVSCGKKITFSDDN
ncbi:RNA recognition motif domain [Arabidopsis suecica]|uniref:RNA recognition motif domain n=1 Tax=Arabidopsis suecica TaxID=45249 RepID=A0A8T1ZY91_ARASU|nr:RNA recognition motif domain [Arabidopsis suecica]